MEIVELNLKINQLRKNFKIIVERPNKTIKEIKEDIGKKIGIKIENIQLLYSSNDLKNEKTLKDYDIQNGATIFPLIKNYKKIKTVSQLKENFNNYNNSDNNIINEENNKTDNNIDDSNKKEESTKFTIERLDYSEELVGTNKKKTFFIDEPAPEGNQLLILSFGKEKVVVNVGYLETNQNLVKISNTPIPMKFKTLYSEEDTEFRDFEYTPNLKRPITIIDPETTEELKPTLYFDKASNEVKGKCKLQAKKRYVVFEIKDNKK